MSDKLGHAGSWSIGGINLPDYKFTENLQSFIFGNDPALKTKEGGSDLNLSQGQKKDSSGGLTTGYGTQGEKSAETVNKGTTTSTQPVTLKTTSTGVLNQSGLKNESPNVSIKSLKDWGEGTFGGQEVGSDGYIWRWDADKKQWDQVRQDTSGQDGKSSTKLTDGQLDELIEIGGEKKTRRSAIQEGLMDEYGNIIQKPVYTGPTEEDLNKAYKPLLDVLAQAEQQLGTTYGQQRQNIESQVQTARNLADEQKRIAEQTISQNDLLGARRRDDVITAARKLFQELQMANQQRFGGASSAGQAASELQGREFMGISGKARQGYADLVSELNNKALEVNNNYSLALQQLEDKKSSALTQAQNDFQNALLQISQQKAGIESEKAQRRLAALEQYRQEVNAINQQQNQFAQRLQLMKAQSDMELDNYKKQLQMAQQGAGQSLQTYVNDPTMSAALSPTTQNQIATTYTGGFNQIDPALLQQLRGIVAGQTNKRDDLTNLYGGLSNIQSMAR